MRDLERATHAREDGSSSDGITHTTSHTPDNAEAEGPTAKRLRLDTDNRPILSSSYRPRKRPDPIPTSTSTSTSIPSPTTSSTTTASSSFPSEHIVTPLSSLSTFNPQAQAQAQTQINEKHHYRPLPPHLDATPPAMPQSSSPSSTPSLASRLSDIKSSLPPPPPLVHSLPPRPQVALPPTIPQAFEPRSRNATDPGPTPGPPVSPKVKEEDSTPSVTVKAEPGTDSPASEHPTPEEIRRRADEVIARLTGAIPTSSASTSAVPSKPEDGAGQSLERRAEDVIARLEREARAREVGARPPIYRPPPPPAQMLHGIHARPPPVYYPYPGNLPRPPPPAGWRPPVGHGPPPGWRPPPPGWRPPPSPSAHMYGAPQPAPPYLSPAHSLISQGLPPHLSPPHISPAHLPGLLPGRSPAAPMLSPSLVTSPSTATSTLDPPSKRKSATPPASESGPILLPRASLTKTTIPPNPQNQIYIGNLPADTKVAALRQAFEAISPILTIELRAPYAMIEFERDGMAEKAVEVYDEGTFGSVQIRVERACP